MDVVKQYIVCSEITTEQQTYISACICDIIAEFLRSAVVWGSAHYSPGSLLPRLVTPPYRYSPGSLLQFTHFLDDLTPFM